MAEQLLQINGLKVSAEDKEILHGIDLTVNRGKTHVLMGPNGRKVHVGLCAYGKSQLYGNTGKHPV